MKEMYERLNSIESIADLKKHKMTLNDLHVSKLVFNELQKSNESKTVIESVAMFYKKNGFNVTYNEILFTIKKAWNTWKK